MTTQESSRRIWRDITVFDGSQTLPDLMAVIVNGGKITALKPMSQIDSSAMQNCIDMGRGGVMTPGLIDCHTHLVYGGSRAAEFEARLEGVKYEDIAKQGGGILSTVNATRSASEDELFAIAKNRLEAMMADGVTTVEIKSGYGLTLADERKMLRVARRLGEVLPVRVTTTFLGAHALPPEFKQNPDAYIDLVCNQMIPELVKEGLVDAVDVFCENIAFSLEQCERVYQAANAHGIPIKAHTEQLSNMGGSALAARYGALSCDHIEYLDADGVNAMKAAGTVAVLLPGAFHTLRETQHPPVQLLREAGVPIAVATDLNPGTSPLNMPTLMLNMACTFFRLTPQEALAGMTSNAAKALGHQELGRISEGATADICVWDVTAPAELSYAVQPNRLRHRLYQGALTHGC